jgi:hypothetical protein
MKLCSLKVAVLKDEELHVATVEGVGGKVNDN